MEITWRSREGPAGCTIGPVTIPVIDMFDATGSSFSHLPAGQVASYITGSGGVPASSAQLRSRPGIVLIDQSPVITAADILADFYDLENGAVTLAEIAQLVKDGQAAYKAGTRPGQRNPGVYCSASQVHLVANALTAGGVTSCPLGVASYNPGRAYAAAQVANASGPYPVVWYQYSDQGGGGAYDLGVASVPWLNTVSGGVRPVLVLNSAGAAVVALQTALNAHGAHLTADGSFGALTLAAVKSFQTSKGLTADGVVGPLTWAALGS